jgi:LysM repeat protein
MNKTISILPNQTLFDVATQYYGSIEAVPALFLLNANLTGVNHVLNVGEVLVINDKYIVDPDVVNYFKINNQTPSSL